MVAKNACPPAGAKAGDGIGGRTGIPAFRRRAFGSVGRFVTWRTDSTSMTSKSTSWRCILNFAKTERAQARLDEQRSIAGIADAVEGDEFDKAQATEALSARVEAAERLKEEVLTTLEKTHDMLDPEQRKRLAYLLRSGQLTI